MTPAMCLKMTRFRFLKTASQGLKQTRTNSEGPMKTIQKNQGNEIPNTSPPPYTEPPKTKYPLLTRGAAESMERRVRRLLYFLFEIIVVTFSADCRRFKKAKLKADFNWITFACPEDSRFLLNALGRAMLTELSTLIRTLQKEMIDDRWLLVRTRDKHLIVKNVLEPVMAEKLNLDYILEIIGRYSRVEGCRKPESTLVDYWSSSSSSKDLGDTIASHILLIQWLQLSPALHDILEDSITTYQKEKGLEELRTSKEFQEESILSLAETCCWPLSNEYMDLAGALRGLQIAMGRKMHDPFGPSRIRLKEGRRAREH